MPYTHGCAATELFDLLYKDMAGDNFVTVDGTSDYLWHYEGWETIPGNRNLTEPRFTTADTVYRINPNLRLIVIVRNPARR